MNAQCSTTHHDVSASPSGYFGTHGTSVNSDKTNNAPAHARRASRFRAYRGLALGAVAAGVLGIDVPSPNKNVSWIGAQYQTQSPQCACPASHGATYQLRWSVAARVRLLQHRLIATETNLLSQKTASEMPTDTTANTPATTSSVE